MGNHVCVRRLQFLRELHFIEAHPQVLPDGTSAGCSSFGNCTSLRHHHPGHLGHPDRLQFLRELHFIEAGGQARTPAKAAAALQFLRELHFIEASAKPAQCSTLSTPVAVPSGTALH